MLGYRLYWYTQRQSVLVATLEVCAILGDVRTHVAGHCIFGKDGLNRTFWLTCPTIDALIRVDVVLIGAFVDAVNWTH
jgi:hypothetical protein